MDMDPISGLLDTADSYARAGDPKAALQFYNEALVEAQQSGVPHPVLLDRLKHAQGFLRQQGAAFQQALNAAMAGRTGANPTETLRMTHALEMIEGKRDIFPQEPSTLFYPYLAHQQFWDPAEFDWSSEIEAATGDIRDELLAVIDEDSAFRPYVEYDEDRPARSFFGLHNDDSWSALHLIKDGRNVEENAKRFPKTMAALAKVPLSNIGRRTPVAHFSRLKPGAHIPPHHGMLNCRLICHLPLIVPPGCLLRVGNETREWQEGKLMMFDDSIQHEARNPTDQVRVILLFDVWRPELGEAEREAISAIFNAIDDYRPLPGS
jgi:hypothetical protein